LVRAAVGKATEFVLVIEAEVLPVIVGNHTQCAMKSANLPHGSQFIMILLEEHNLLRVSLDDLPDYFHTLALEDKCTLMNQTGRPFSTKELVAAGIPLTAAQRSMGFLCFALCALPMGSLHAVDWSQDYHENIITKKRKCHITLFYIMGFL